MPKRDTSERTALLKRAAFGLRQLGLAYAEIGRMLGVSTSRASYLVNTHWQDE
jgi:DNA-directed RNA polymerase specialized sigma24 family protein